MANPQPQNWHNLQVAIIRALWLLEAADWAAALAVLRDITGAEHLDAPDRGAA